MKRCAHCGGKFGLIRQTWFKTQFCSKKCRDRHLDRLAQDRERVRRWFACLRPT
jgi:endogenous inhibitor of DNA gyrase (YacG/DUF329 family)